MAIERDEFERAPWRVMVAAEVEQERLTGPRTLRFFSSVTIEGMGPSLSVGGATTKAVFDAYVAKALAPRLKEGQIVVMDHLGAYRPKRVR